MATLEATYTPFAGTKGGSLGSELRKQTAGVRLALNRFTARKTFNAGQIMRTANEFEAEAKMLGASKKLLDVDSKQYRAVCSVLSRARSYWNMMTVEYPVRGTRLIRKSNIKQFEEFMTGLVEELRVAVDALEASYAELREQARVKLGDLFNENDYPPTLRGEFGIAWDYPSVEPPDYLKQLNPELWEREHARIQARFDEAAVAMEAAFAHELQELVGHLLERLTGEEDGKPKTFRDSAVKNLGEFFERFRSVSVGSSAELDDLIAKTMGVLNGADPAKLRKDDAVRETVREELAAVASALDTMLIDKPNRAISLEDCE